MKTTLMNPEVLAQRLESAARSHERFAADWRTARPANPGMVSQLERQALESREWAKALRNVRRIGFEGDDIEVTHDD